MKYLFFLGCSLLASAPALAEGCDPKSDPQCIVIADRLRDDLITVVATGSAQRLDWSGQPIAVLGRSEIEQVQGPDLTRVLERLPGVPLSGNGGLGGLPGPRVRRARVRPGPGPGSGGQG